MSNMASIFDIGHPRPSHAHTLRCSASRAHTGSYVDRIIGCYSKGFSCTQAMGEVGRLKIWRRSCGGARHPQNGYRGGHIATTCNLVTSNHHGCSNTDQDCGARLYLGVPLLLSWGGQWGTDFLR